MARRIAKISLLLLVVLLVGCDHATKQAASTMLAPHRPFELVPGILDLQYSQNHDTAFSVLARFGVTNAMFGIAFVSALVLAGICVMWYQRRHIATRLEHLGYAFAVAGAIGNVGDRIVRGFVVDFIHLHHWPIFNVADVAIVVGMGLIMIASFRARPKPA